MSRIFNTNTTDNYTAFYDSPKIGAGIEIKNPVPVEATITKPSLRDYIKTESKKRGLDYKVVYAVIEVESRWQADLVGDRGESFGLMQIQPRWHQKRMERLGVTDLLDPEQNVKAGCDLLAELIEKTNGDIDAALTIYNVGHDNGGREYAERVKEKFEKIREQ